MTARLQDEKSSKGISQELSPEHAPYSNTALNMLGLSTQVTAVWSYISDSPYKTYEWNVVRQ